MDATDIADLIRDGIGEPALASEKAMDYINLALEKLEQMAWWRHLEAYPPHQFSVSGPYATGTVTVTNGSATVTGVGTDFTGRAGQVFQKSGDSNYYWIDSVASATSMTLKAAYIGTTAAGASYNIHTVMVSLPSTLSMPKVKGIVIQNPFRELDHIDETERVRTYTNLLQSTGQPKFYTPLAKDKILLYPPPDASYLFELRHQKSPTEVSDAQTTIDFPPNMHRGIAKLAIAEGWREKGDDTQADTIEAEALRMLGNSMSNNAKRADYTPKMKPFDNKGLQQGVLRSGIRVTGDPFVP